MPLTAADIVDQLLDLPAAPLGVAVSGGSDSLALLGLLQDWGARDLRVVTVDHGLRQGSAGEAAHVAAICRDRSLAHQTLRWESWGGQGNLQDAARRARYDLIADWAGSEGIGAVALGHTLEDQAETFLMRLARGSGVDGLSAMTPRTEGRGLCWLRPLLRLRRADLKAFLEQKGWDWVTDPSNDDTGFERVRMRQAMPALEALGLHTERLAATADRMALARQALESMAYSVAREAIDATNLGTIRLRKAGIAKVPPETRLRLLAAALCWVSGAEYRPRLSSLKTLAQSSLSKVGTATLHGCVIRWTEDDLTVDRELARAGESVAAGILWDGRWMSRPERGAHVAALGEVGLAQTPDWRASGIDRLTLLTVPGIWRDDRLLAHPVLLPQENRPLSLKNPPDTFFTGLISR